MVATGLLATAIVTLAQLFALSTQTNMASRNTTYASVLAEQKIEELRALAWGFDTQGLAAQRHDDEHDRVAANADRRQGALSFVLGLFTGEHPGLRRLR